MGRIRQEVQVDGRGFWALFDTGAIHTYVVDEVASLLPTFTLDRPRQVEKECRLACLIEGRPISTLAQVLPEIGTDEEGKRIEVLVGALTMQQWRIRPVPEEERLDMTHYPEVWVEF